MCVRKFIIQSAFAISAVFVLVFVMPIGVVQAQVSTVQALNFGEFISTRNDASYDIVVNANGSYSFTSGAFFEIVPPQRGIYDFNSLPINTAITSVVVTQNIPLISLGQPVFQMLNFQETHPVSTSPSGIARIIIGATARTSGAGTMYGDRTYSGELNIQINF